MNVLITGGAGFVGSHLCKHFLSKGEKVICVDNLSTGRRVNVESFLNEENFRFLDHDISEPIEDLGDLDVIYNLASPASPPHYQKDPIFTWKSNVIGTLNMLELSKKTGAVIIQASTSEVYGDPAVHPQTESYWGNVNPIGIRSCYDESKRAAETIIMDFVRQHGTKAKIVRIFNTYGPNMDPLDGRVVSNFIIQALKGEDLTVYGEGSQTRSFQYVDDLVAGFIKMLDTPDDFNGPVNIGNPREFTILELAALVLKLVPNNSKIIHMPLPQDDPTQRCPDISLAKEILDWSPKVSLEEGLEKTIPYFRETISK